MCREKAWTNFLFTNNQLANGGCYNTSWSLAVQMQFYAVLPLALVMLRPRTPGFRCATNLLWYLMFLILCGQTIIRLCFCSTHPQSCILPHQNPECGILAYCIMKHASQSSGDSDKEKIRCRREAKWTGTIEEHTVQVIDRANLCGAGTVFGTRQQQWWLRHWSTEQCCLPQTASGSTCPSPCLGLSAHI